MLVLLTRLKIFIYDIKFKLNIDHIINMISENFEKLFEAAKLVRQRAHVPYSNFKVGAAFLTNDGSIITGCNVENAAYPQSQCAEASAIGNLVAQGYKKIIEIVVVGSGDSSAHLVVDVDKDLENFLL